MKTKINYFDNDLEVEALKLWFYMPPTFLDDYSFTHVLRFLRFLTLFLLGVGNIAHPRELF